MLERVCSNEAIFPKKVSFKKKPTGVVGEARTASLDPHGLAVFVRHLYFIHDEAGFNYKAKMRSCAWS